MSFSETVFLFLLALIIFGPKKLPEIARQVGRALNEFRRASNEFKAQIEQEIAHLEDEIPRPQILPPSPAPQGAVASDSWSAAAVDPPPPGGAAGAPQDQTPTNGRAQPEEGATAEGTIATSHEVPGETAGKPAPVNSAPGSSPDTLSVPQGPHA